MPKAKRRPARRKGIVLTNMDGRPTAELVERWELGFFCGVCGTPDQYARPAFAPKERMRLKTGYYTWGARLCRACLAYIGEVYLLRRAELLLPLAVEGEVQEKREMVVERELDCRLRYDGWPVAKVEEGNA